MSLMPIMQCPFIQPFSFDVPGLQNGRHRPQRRVNVARDIIPGAVHWGIKDWVFVNHVSTLYYNWSLEKPETDE